VSRWKKEFISLFISLGLQLYSLKVAHKSVYLADTLWFLFFSFSTNRTTVSRGYLCGSASATSAGQPKDATVRRRLTRDRPEAKKTDAEASSEEYDPNSGHLISSGVCICRFALSHCISHGCRILGFGFVCLFVFVATCQVVMQLKLTCAFHQSPRGGGVRSWTLCSLCPDP